MLLRVLNKIYQSILINSLFYYCRLALISGHEQDDALKEQRKKEVENNQKLYKWGSDSRYSKDLPGFIKAATPLDLPKDVQFTFKECWSLLEHGAQGFANLKLGDFFSHFESWDSFDDFRKCITPVIGDLPPAADRWQDDVWYGRQFLNASNPDMIMRCTDLPKKFPVTNTMVSNLLDRKTTLKQAMQVIL